MPQNFKLRHYQRNMPNSGETGTTAVEGLAATRAPAPPVAVDEEGHATRCEILVGGFCSVVSQQGA
jgi:hypothetical protein